MTENGAGTRVGWIGLGAMGFPMAGCVARAGFDVSAYDINPARSKALTTEGVKPTASINEAASGADVFIIMVATPTRSRACSSATTLQRPRSRPARQSS